MTFSHHSTSHGNEWSSTETHFISSKKGSNNYIFTLNTKQTMYIGDSPHINCISGAMISMQKIMGPIILGRVKPKTIRLVFDTSPLDLIKE